MKYFASIAILFVLSEISFATHGGYSRYHSGCIKHCPTTILKACGSDGVTYVNECALKKYSCENPHLKLRKLYEGNCEAVFGRLRGAVFDPVCASDGNTYSSVSFIKVAECLRRNYINVLSKGLCSCRQHCEINVSKCDIGCALIYNPVCGDDGNSYVNQCALEKQNCILGGKALKRINFGICEAVFQRVRGIAPFSPVCGSDGNTYASKDYFEVARCENPYVTIVKYEAC